VVNLTTYAKVNEWSHNTGYQGAAPDEVMLCYRFLAVMQCMGLISTRAFYRATNKCNIAKLVIAKILEEF
jgi:hypothetical protein